MVSNHLIQSYSDRLRSRECIGASWLAVFAFTTLVRWTRATGTVINWMKIDRVIVSLRKSLRTSLRRLVTTLMMSECVSCVVRVGEGRNDGLTVCRYIM